MAEMIDEESVFHQAIEIKETSARNVFLEKSCIDQPDARQRLAELIEMHFGAGKGRRNILDETQVCTFNPGGTANVPAIGSQIGPYKLLEEIGEGGMGVVFMAQQSEPVKRKVALKVIKIGMDTRRVVARFESERQAMAMMDHPCITKIFDAGATEFGRPYFVMELVNGSSITSYCDQHRLNVRQRLEIFVQVCNACEHAHQKGIIHRDIKPNNILVTNHDGRPTPKIIDFGIAKAINDPLTDKTLFTNYGEMIGTPLYMSPEQSELSQPDIDTRTDIYSLGVLLYELLTGTTPFHNLKKKSWHEIGDAIRSHEPQLASTRINNLGDTDRKISTNRDTDVRSLRRFIRGELDWILMKCLARDRSRRYQSAGELSREITRYLNGDLVEAAAPSWTYQTQKYIARHKTFVAVAASFAAILIAGTVFSSMMALKANSAEQLASRRLDLAIKERDRALIAEKQLAELERKQRNRIAFHQAASSHNADMMKKFIAETPGVESRIAPRPAIQLRPLGSYWKSKQNFPKGNPTITGMRSNNSVGSLPENQSRTWMFDDGQGDNIEVIVAADDTENQESLLKSILHHQRQAFGGQDVLVAQTLNQLGELTSDRQKWKQSEQYFREAVEILKKSADDTEQLSSIRQKLANALRKQGDLKKVVAEIQVIKEEIQESETYGKLNGLFENLKSSIRQPGLHENPDLP